MEFFEQLTVIGPSDDMECFLEYAENRMNLEENITESRERGFPTRRFCGPNVAEFEFASFRPCAIGIAFESSPIFPSLVFITTGWEDSNDWCHTYRTQYVYRNGENFFYRHIAKTADDDEVEEYSLHTLKVAAGDGDGNTAIDANDLIDEIDIRFDELDTGEESHFMAERADRLAKGDPKWNKRRSYLHLVTVAGEVDEVRACRELLEGPEGTHITGVSVVPVWQAKFSHPIHWDQEVHEEQTCWVEYRWRSDETVDAGKLKELSRVNPNITCLYQRDERPYRASADFEKRVWRDGKQTMHVVRSR